MNTIDLKGRAAVVTGGARGIGYATAQKMLASGASVNIEADVLVKLAWQQMQDQSKSEAKSESAPTFEMTEPWLVANGY